MKKRVEHEELLADVLTGNKPCRAATLEHGLAVLRRVRARRRAARLTVSTALPLLVLGAMLMVQSRRDAATSAATGSGPGARVAKTIEALRFGC